MVVSCHFRSNIIPFLSLIWTASQIIRCNVSASRRCCRPKLDIYSWYYDTTVTVHAQFEEQIHERSQEYYKDISNHLATKVSERTENKEVSVQISFHNIGTSFAQHPKKLYVDLWHEI